MNDCTSQQAFYKLRNSIAITQCIHKSNVTTKSDLQILFPRNNRRKKIAAIEKDLGFKIKILRPKHWLANTPLLIQLASFIGLFYYWRLGLTVLFLSIVLFNLASKFANEFDLQNVGEVADKISRENYLKARRNSATVNKNEIDKKVKELFSKDLDLEESVLTREATFV